MVVFVFTRIAVATHVVVVVHHIVARYVVWSRVVVHLIVAVFIGSISNFSEVAQGDARRQWRVERQIYAHFNLLPRSQTSHRKFISSLNCTLQ